MTTPSAVVTLPRGSVKSRRISRVLAGLALSSSAWKTVSRLSCTNSSGEADHEADPEQPDLAGHAAAAASRWAASSEIRRRRASST